LPTLPPHNDEFTDEQLMRQIRERRPEALSRVYDLHATLVYSVAMRVLHDPAAAEDVMQEVFLRLWQQPESYSGERGNLCGWLTVVTRNRAIDRIRSSRKMENIDDWQLPARIDLGADAEREILLEKARTVMQTMPADQRQVFEMAFFEGHTHTEIAEKTGQPLGTIKSRIRSALMTLRKAFDVPA
jgi:RNA polymerase sigma-70 factor (ECF subfamily)